MKTKLLAAGALSLTLLVPGAGLASSNSGSNSQSTSQSNSASGGGNTSQSNSSSQSQSISQSNSGGGHHRHGGASTPAIPNGATPLNQVSARLFLGSMLIGGDGGWTGAMVAHNPTCVYTLSDATLDSNGGYPMSGAGSCPGDFDLILNTLTGNSGLSDFGQFDVIDLSTGSLVTTGDYSILYGTATPNTGQEGPATNLVIRLDGVTTINNIN